MPSHAHSHDHNHDHGHAHAPHHGHAHPPTSPHPPMVLAPSFMRLSIAARLGVALLASSALWGAVWLAMR
jgi:hypothetical protein